LFPRVHNQSYKFNLGSNLTFLCQCEQFSECSLIFFFTSRKSMLTDLSNANSPAIGTFEFNLPPPSMNQQGDVVAETDYEVARLQNIKRNKELLASLGLIGLVASEKKGKSPTPALSRSVHIPSEIRASKRIQTREQHKLVETEKISRILQERGGLKKSLRVVEDSGGESSAEDESEESSFSSNSGSGSASDVEGSVSASTDGSASDDLEVLNGFVPLGARRPPKRHKQSLDSPTAKPIKSQHVVVHDGEWAWRADKVTTGGSSSVSARPSTSSQNVIVGRKRKLQRLADLDSDNDHSKENVKKGKQATRVIDDGDDDDGVVVLRKRPSVILVADDDDDDDDDDEDEDEPKKLTRTSYRPSVTPINLSCSSPSPTTFSSPSTQTSPVAPPSHNNSWPSHQYSPFSVASSLVASPLIKTPGSPIRRHTIILAPESPVSGEDSIQPPNRLLTRPPLAPRSLLTPITATAASTIIPPRQEIIDDDLDFPCGLEVRSGWEQIRSLQSTRETIRNKQRLSE
jgi:hypothetical protein